MLTPWLELAGAADRLATWSEISGLDLAQLGTTATAEEITDTAVTQPLVVAAGAVSALEKLAEDPPAKARVRVLATAGAFHTHFMGSAQEPYAAAAATVTPSEPTTTLLSNADGQPVADAADAMTKLVAQMTRPVRWDLCSATLRERFDGQEVTGIIEFPPAGTLTGIAKREVKGVPTFAIKTPADLDGLTEF